MCERVSEGLVDTGRDHTSLRFLHAPGMTFEHSRQAVQAAAAAGSVKRLVPSSAGVWMAILVCYKGLLLLFCFQYAALRALK